MVSLTSDRVSKDYLMLFVLRSLACLVKNVLLGVFFQLITLGVFVSCVFSGFFSRFVLSGHCFFRHPVGAFLEMMLSAG